MANSKKNIEKVGDKEQYIKSPRPYNELQGDFTLMQERALTRIGVELAPRADAVVDKHNKEHLPMGDLFQQYEADNGIHKIYLPVSTFGLAPKDYPDIVKACEDLISAKVYDYSVDTKGAEHWKVSNIFKSIECVMDANGKRSEIVLEVYSDMASRIFTLANGYSEYSRKIVDYTRNRRAIKLYRRLSNYRSIGYAVIEYRELKDFFGVVEYKDNKRENGVKSDSYERYSHFKRHVLLTIKAELDRLVKDGKLDFSFEIEEINKTPKKKSANPDAIKFTLVPPLAEAIEVKEQSSISKSMDKLERERKVTEVKRQFLFTSFKDFQLFRALLDKGNEWAVAHQTCEYDVDDFEAELKKEGLI